ncbi:TadE/TadG family type IV pilus assembly protein [Brevundimonas sp. NPDC090276]|uniref:TadE/TadG family type IV pilus assembly protein n=1 Tax=Brevundimonas sp. NPDC090276 TaxID=3363956 RepID=UPI00383AB896
MARRLQRDTKRPSFARRLMRARDGSAAVEFAMIALPFFMLLFAILEIGLILLLDAVVETAVTDTGRLVRTGQAQMQAVTKEAMMKKFCSQMSVFSGDCPSRAFMDVRVVNGFSNPLDETDPLFTGAFDAGKTDFKPGKPGDRIMVRVWYRHPIVTPFLAQALSRSNDGKILLTTTMAFQNEPYQ